MKREIRELLSVLEQIRQKKIYHENTSKMIATSDNELQYHATDKRNLEADIDLDNELKSFKAYVLKEADITYSGMYNVTSRSPYENELNALLQTQEYSKRAQEYHKRMEEERLGFNRSLDAIKENKKRNKEKALARKNAIKKTVRTIWEMIVGLFFLSTALFEGLGALLLFGEHLPKAVQELLKENVLTETRTEKIVSFISTLAKMVFDVSDMKSEVCMLIAFLGMFLLGMVLNGINIGVCDRMLKKHKNAFLKFCRVFMLAIFIAVWAVGMICMIVNWFPI